MPEKVKNVSALVGKRVLFVFCSFDLGGAERQGMHLARHLKAIGCDVHVWSTLLRGGGLVAEQCEAFNIPWEEHRFLWPCRKSSLIRDCLRFLRALWNARPDVILSYTTSPNVVCGLLWRLSSAKVCIWGQRNIKDLRDDFLERLSYRQVSAVVCNAEHEVGYLRETLGETRAPISVVHNGVELEACHKTRNEWREKLGIGADALVVTMLANFRKQKDHKTLLLAWKQIISSVPADVSVPHLLFAGGGQDTYESVCALASEFGLLDNSVHILGQVKDVSGLLAASDIGVLISAKEGLSNSVIEYMASGLPVVATDHPGNREALGSDPQQPFAKDGDSSSVTGCLQRLLFDSGLRKSLGVRNRDRAVKEFSIESMCHSMESVIKQQLDIA